MIDISLRLKSPLALENKLYKLWKLVCISFEGVKITSFGVLQPRKANNFSNGSTVVFRETAGRLEPVL